MSILDLFCPKRKLSRAADQWNRMWELWAAQEVPSPHLELMYYYSEVCNGGHGQYFINTEMIRDLDADVKTLTDFLPEVHAENLRLAYAAYNAAEAGASDSSDSEDAPIEDFDTVFFLNEDSIEAMLRAYADTIML